MLLSSLSLGCAANALDPVGITHAMAEADLTQPEFVMLIGEALVSDAVAVSFFNLIQKVNKESALLQWGKTELF